MSFPNKTRRVLEQVIAVKYEDYLQLKEERDAYKADAERLLAALDYVIRDLELRANMQPGKDKGLVAIGNGAYTQAKEAIDKARSGK